MAEKTERIPVNLSLQEKTLLEEAARIAGLPVSLWLKTLGMQKAKDWGLTLKPEDTAVERLK